jgi:WD40 repeat protein/predicted Ser/Thr protein kinase
MIADTPSVDQSPSLAALALVDEICLRFEVEWRAGRRPLLEAFLADASGSVRQELLVALLAIELGYRCRHGEALAAVEYLHRFPEAAAVLPQLIAEAAGNEGRGGQTTPTGAGSAAISPARADRLAVLGDYDILEELGRGGMGVVYKARQRSANRVVALKVIRADRLEGGSAEERQRWLDRFHREGQAAARLVHDHILPVYEVGQAAGRHFYSMRYVAGRSLAEVLRDGPLPERAAAVCLERVARAIDYAHAQGILHRDLKPGNILLDADQRPYVTDYGLAKWMEGPQDMTQTGQWLGSPPYLSPEQAQDAARVTAASDVYSLGATLYHALTGRPPFQAANVLETLRQVREDDPVPPRQLNSAVPRDLETICLKCLTKQLAKRYPSARELADDLRRFLAGEPIQARPVHTLERGWKWAKRRPTFTALGVVIVFVTLVGFPGVTWLWRRAEIARQQAAQSAQAEAQTKKELEINLYFRNIALAERELSANSVVGAKDLLDQCPPYLRGWEWHYLNRLYHADRHVTLRGHTDEVRSAAFSPDGKRLASASFDRTVRIWDVAARQELLILQGHSHWVRGVAFSPDGRQVASASRDQTVKVWDATTGKELLTLRHDHWLIAVAFSPDGKWLAAADTERTVKFWDAKSGCESHTISGHSNRIWNFTFSPAGDRIATASADQTVKVWDASSGQEIVTLRGHRGTVLGVAFSPDGTRLASASGDRTLRIWDVTTGQEIFTLYGHSSTVNSVAFSRDGKHLVSASFDQTVRIWDAYTGQEIRALRGHTRGVASVAFRRDDKAIASASEDTTVKIWDISGNPEPTTLRGHPVIARDVVFSPDGQWIASAGKDKNDSDLPSDVKLWDARTHQVFHALKGHTGAIYSVAFSPDGQLLASAGSDQTVKIWNVISGQALGSLHGHTQAIRSVMFSPNGQQIATGSDDRTVKIWRATNGREIFTLRGHTDRVFSVAFSPNGRRLASASWDRTIKLWDTTTGQETISLHGHKHYVSCVAFSPDGRHLASASKDLTVKIWDTTTGEEVRTLSGHRAEVHGVTFSPDGQRLASASWDHTIKLWDVTTGNEAITLRRHAHCVFRVAFSPNGHRLASASQDGTVILWSATPLGDETQ